MTKEAKIYVRTLADDEAEEERRTAVREACYRKAADLGRELTTSEYLVIAASIPTAKEACPCG